ncbi:MAG: hypothetical protein ABSE89_02645 [Sedimentisphaerales bacterium]
MNETVNNEKKTGYVAHFDMLGCRKAVEYSDRNTWEALNYLFSLIPYIIRRGQQETKIDESTGQKIRTSDHIRIINISDTIIIYTEQIKFEDFFSLFVTASTIFMRSLVDAGIPLRGGVASGDFYIDPTKNLYSGMPFIRAYDAGETAQWLGIVIDPDTYRVNLKDMPNIKDIPYFVKWDVPVKSGKTVKTEKKIVVNWPFVYSKIENFNFPKSAKELYERKCHCLFGPYEKLDNEVKRKYENTQAFIDAQLK